MNYDEILIAIGGCGLYQNILFFVLGLTCLQAGIDLEANIFMLFTPSMTCKDDVFLNFTNSSGFQKLDECTVQRISSADNSSISSPEMIKCTSWEYDQSVFRSSFVTEYDLVCDHAYLTTIIESLYFAGISVGMLIGILGDKYGRRKLILACAVLEVMTSVMTPFANHLAVLMMLRTARGFSQSIYYQGVSLLFEVVPIQYRAAYGANYWLFWSLGYIMTPLAAYLCREWRSMKLYLSLPQILYITFIFLVPESPRWLMAQGRQKEALDVLRKIAKWNRCKQLPPLLRTKQPVNPEDMLINETAEKKKVESNDRMIDAFLKPNLRLKILSFWMILASIAIGYSGLSLDGKFASDDIFLNVFYMGLIEFPTGPLAWLLCEKIGRRLPLAVSLFTGALAILATPFLRRLSLPWLSTLVAIFGKLLLTTAYQGGDIYVVEIFPTTLRGMGVFTACMWAQITTIIAPFINRLSQHVFFGSALIYSSTMFISSVLTFLFLPETKGCPMPQTVEEAESFRRGNEKEWTRKVLEAEGKQLGCEEVPLLPDTAPTDGIRLEILPVDCNKEMTGF